MEGTAPFGGFCGFALAALVSGALWRGLGNTGEIATYPASLRLHGKFFVQELDYDPRPERR
jgi:hypothetical protein